MAKLTHTTDDGSARMVDVSRKPAMEREALAEGFISMTPETLRLVRENEIAKGDVLTVAHIAGIQAAKQTALLIPLCHQLPLSAVHVAFELRSDGIAITARARTIAGTGVEMEALTAVSVAALTIYDMCKAVDRAMVISGVRLVEKTKRQLT